MVWPDVVMFGDASLIAMAYFALGIVVYGQLEHWNFQDTLYFLLTSCTTIGYGDMVPRTETAKMFTAVYVPLGFIPVFKMALPYGRAICQSMQGLVDGLIPASCRRGPTMVSEIEGNDLDLGQYAAAFLGPLVVIAAGAGLAWRFLYYSPADAVYFAATTLTTVGYGDLTPHDLPREMVTGFFGVVAAGTFFACVEQCYKIASSRQVKAVDLRKFADELLLQESPWDSAWPKTAPQPLPPPAGHGNGSGSGHGSGSAAASESTTAGAGAAAAYQFARRADDGLGLSEAEFVIAVLTGHSVIDVAALVSIRKQFRTLMQTAEKAGVPGAGSGGGGEGVEPRLDAKAIFAILLSEGKVRQRGAEQAKGGTFEVTVQEGQQASQTPGSLVDLTADDGGFGEWRDNVWALRCKELREKASAALGTAEEGDAEGNNGHPPAAQGSKAELV